MVKDLGSQQSEPCWCAQSGALTQKIPVPDEANLEVSGTGSKTRIFD